MKQRVELSGFCVISTAICLVLFFVSFFFIPEIWWQITWGCFISILLIICLCYMPMSIGADEKAIYINRSLKVKTIPISSIKTVDLYTPSAGAIRTCGSGGFLGYWGWFRDRKIGKYFAYYGKSSDCFLIKLKNGHKYILGCKNAPDMVEYINKLIKK